MGDVVPFRDQRKWTRPEDYGHDPREPGGGSGGNDGGDGPGGKPPRRRWRMRGFSALGFWGLVVTGLTVWVGSDPALIAPPAFLAGDPEVVTGPFPRCGRGSSRACVVDGDTIRVGQRAIRIIGIDAPELHPARCAAEARAGEAAAAHLVRLLAQGPVTITGRIDAPRDKYGRELRVITRTRKDGTVQSIADDMIASRTVRPYAGEARASWC